MALLGTKANFSQRDPKWSGNLLGFAKWQTMGGYGCLVTAYADVAQASGKDVDPGQLNELFKKHNLFSVDSVGEKSDVSRLDALSVIYPDIKHVENKNWGNNLADINYFDVRSTTKTEIIVQIDYHPEKAGIQQHWCRVIGINAARNDVEIVDAYTGKRIWLSSLGRAANRLIYRAIKFSGPGSSSSSTKNPASPPAPAQSVRVNPGQWNVRTTPNGTIRSDGLALGGQIYGAEIVDGWAKISFRGKTGYIGPKAFKKV